MNKAEKKILHGVYHHREMVGEEVPYSAAELNWLINASFEEGKHWQQDEGAIKSFESPHENWLTSIAITVAAAERPLSYLRECGYIEFKKENSAYRVKITGFGADTARELATWYGRINLQYKQYKEGLFWLLTTVLASLITTLITQSCRAPH